MSSLAPLLSVVPSATGPGRVVESAGPHGPSVATILLFALAAIVAVWAAWRIVRSARWQRRISSALGAVLSQANDALRDPILVSQARRRVRATRFPRE